MTDDAKLLLSIHARQANNHATYALEAAAMEGLDDDRVSNAYAELLKLGYVEPAGTYTSFAVGTRPTYKLTPRGIAAAPN